MHTMTTHAIDPARLDAVRAAGEDGWGNPFTPYAAVVPVNAAVLLRFARAASRSR